MRNSFSLPLLAPYSFSSAPARVAPGPQCPGGVPAPAWRISRGPQPGQERTPFPVAGRLSAAAALPVSGRWLAPPPAPLIGWLRLWRARGGGAAGRRRLGAGHGRPTAQRPAASAAQTRPGPPVPVVLYSGFSRASCFSPVINSGAVNHRSAMVFGLKHDGRAVFCEGFVWFGLGFEAFL